MIKIKVVAAMLLALATSFALAQQVPSEASINDSLKVMNTRAAIDNVEPQVRAMLRSSMQKALNEGTATPGQRKIMDEMQARFAKLYADESGSSSIRRAG